MQLGTTSTQLPRWAMRAIEELQESTRWSRHWEPEQWGASLVVGELVVTGDAAAGARIGHLSVRSAQLMVALVRGRVRIRDRVAAIWAICCCKENCQEILAVLGMQATNVEEWCATCQEWASAVMAARAAWEGLESKVSVVSRYHPANILWRRTMSRARGLVRPGRDGRQEERDEQQVQAGARSTAWLERPVRLLHAGRWLTAHCRAHLLRLEERRRDQFNQALDWLAALERDQTFRRLTEETEAAAAVRQRSPPSEMAKWLTGEGVLVINQQWWLNGWDNGMLLPTVQAALQRLGGEKVRVFRVAISMVRRRAIFSASSISVGQWMRPLGVEEFRGVPQSWTQSMLPASSGRRHPLWQREVDAKRMRDLQVHKRKGCWLVSARRIIADVARRGLPVGAAQWGKRARALLRGALCRMVDPTEPTPTLVASPSQLLYRVGDGQICILAVEEEAAILEVSLVENTCLGMILLGQATVGHGMRPAPLTALQAHAALADGMHVGAVAAVVSKGWELVLQMHGDVNFNMVRVHTSCAGLVNAGYLAVERAMGERHVTTRLVVATELVGWRREALAMQYPLALLVAQAAGGRAFSRHAHILVASWPCKPYSTANVEGRVAASVWTARAWENTVLFGSILAGACSQVGGPPLLLVFENVAGLLTRKKCRPMLRHMLGEMALSPFTWFSQIVCARKHTGGQCLRPRLFLVGVLRRPPPAGPSAM